MDIPVGFLVYVGTAIAVMLGGAVTVYLLTRRFGRLAAVLLALLTGALLIGFWPVPIHGGATFLGEELYREWRSQLKKRRYEAVERKKEEFVDALTDRFSGTLPVSGGAPVDDGWRRVRVAEEQAWLDITHHLIWSDWIPVVARSAQPSLHEAKTTCLHRRPEGFWALATEAENALAWQAGGAKVLPRPNVSSMAYTIDADFGLELPTFQMRGHRSNEAVADDEARNTGFVVRCVARAEGAPERGYTRADVPLDLWNRYQMSRLN